MVASFAKKYLETLRRPPVKPNAIGRERRPFSSLAFCTPTTQRRVLKYKWKVSSNRICTIVVESYSMIYVSSLISRLLLVIDYVVKFTILAW